MRRFKVAKAQWIIDDVCTVWNENLQILKVRAKFLLHKVPPDQQTCLGILEKYLISFI